MKDITQRAQSPSKERRGITGRIELRDAEAGSGLDFAGYAAVFEQAYTVYDAFGEYQERVSSGAYTKTLADKADVRLLINHEGVPIARTSSGTLTLTQDKTGLHSSAPGLDPANPTVQEVKSAMKRGDIDQMSHSFRVIRQEWNGDYTERNIIEAELFDVSIVTFPASPTTSAAMRSRELLEVLQDLDGVPAEQLLVGMRSNRHMPTARSLRSLRGAINQMLTSRAMDAMEDPMALCCAVDAAIDAVVAALAGGNVDQAKALLTAAEAASDAMLEAMGAMDPDDMQSMAKKMPKKKMPDGSPMPKEAMPDEQITSKGSSIALLRRELELINS